MKKIRKAHKAVMVSSTYEVTKPSITCEFEVQSYLFNELKCLGYEVYGEVKYKRILRDHHGYTDIRDGYLDLAIFSKEDFLIGIEVKRSSKSITVTPNVFQRRIYESMNMPIQFIYGMEHAKEFIEACKTTGKCSIIKEKPKTWEVH